MDGSVPAMTSRVEDMTQRSSPFWNRGIPAAPATPARALLAGLCLMLAGCPNSAGGGRLSSWTDVFKPRSRLAVATAAADEGPSANQPGGRRLSLAALVLHFDVLRAQVPRGVFSESGKIWNHLDEQVVPADTAVLLQRNGLRIARGPMTAWAPIKALLDAEEDVSSIGNAMTISNGQPLTIELDEKPHDQTLFLFRRDGSWPGATFPASMNLLRVEYEIPAASPDSVSVNVMPEVRLQAPEPAMTPQGWVHPPVVPPSRIFRELAVCVLIGPDEFLAVGPSLAARSAHTIGGLMLTQETLGQEYECMFFITPRVVRKGWTGESGGSGPAVAPVKR